MNRKPPFGLLLIGGGHTHQESYARQFAADKRCRLVGLTDEPDLPQRRRALNLQLAAELKIPYFEDFDAAIRRDDVDFVSICAEEERRANVTIACARAGKHVYIDKTPASRVDDALTVVGAIREAGVLNQTFSLVHTPAAERARRVLQSGELGELVGLHAELFFAKGRGGSADLSKRRVESPAPEHFTFIEAKRELYCIGLYPLLLFSWLTGSRFSSVQATTSNYFFAEHQKNDAEDFSCLLLQMERGVDATIMVGRTGWSSHPNSGVNAVHLVGTKKTVTIDAFRPRLEIHSDAPPFVQPERPHPDDPMGFWASTVKQHGVKPKNDWLPVRSPLTGEMSYFLDCLEQQRESDMPAETGAHAVEVMLAAYQSAATGRAVEVSSVR